MLLRPSIVRRHGLTEVEVDGLLLEIVLNATMGEPAVSNAGRDSTSGGADPAPPVQEAGPAGDVHVVALLRTMPGCALVTGHRRMAETVRSWSKVITPSDFVTAFRV